MPQRLDNLKIRTFTTSDLFLIGRLCFKVIATSALRDKHPKYNFLPRIKNEIPFY